MGIDREDGKLRKRRRPGTRHLRKNNAFEICFVSSIVCVNAWSILVVDHAIFNYNLTSISDFFL